MDFERGIDSLKRLAEGTGWYQDFTVHEAALRENLSDERRYGPSEQTRRDRTRIVDQLNALALAHLNISFNDLCLAKPSSSYGSGKSIGDGAPSEIGAIRELLLAAFTAEGLRRFCRYRQAFRPIVDTFSPNDGLDSMVEKVIIYCENHLLFAELLFAVKQENPRQYDRFHPVLGTLEAGSQSEE